MVNDNKAVNLFSAFESFVEALESEGRSINTIKWYIGHLQDIVLRLRDTPIDNIDPSAIRAYFNELRQRETTYRGGRIVPGRIAEETIRGRYRAMKIFFNWVINEYDLSPKANPTRKIKPPMVGNRMPKGISMDDIRRLWNVTSNDTVGIRDRAIILFMLDTGCRAGGLISLTDENLFIDEGRAILNEKGSRSRVVPFTRDTAGYLRKWLDVRPVGAKTIFCRFGTVDALIGERLTLTGLREIFRRLAKRGGVEGKFNPHSFRHANAREFLKNGGDLSTLQQILGHSSSNTTTAYYARFLISELASKQEKHSPAKALLRALADKKRG